MYLNIINESLTQSTSLIIHSDFKDLKFNLFLSFPLKILFGLGIDMTIVKNVSITLRRYLECDSVKKVCFTNLTDCGVDDK